MQWPLPPFLSLKSYGEIFTYVVNDFQANSNIYGVGYQNDDFGINFYLCSIVLLQLTKKISIYF